MGIWTADIAAAASGAVPAAHADSHENDGADEIDATGLTGVSSDTGSPVSEFWATPETAHAFDYEADTGTLPGAFTLWDISTSPAVSVSPISGIDVFSQPTTGNVRIEANKTNRRSWILFQPRGETKRWFYSQQVTLSGTAGWILRSRIGTHIKGLSGSNNAATIRFTVCKDDGSNKPNVNSGGGGPQTGIACGWESDASNMLVEFVSFNNATPTTYATGPDVDGLAVFDFEIVYTLRSGASSVIWDLWFRTNTLTILAGTFTATGLGIGQGNTVHVGWEFTGVDANMPSAPIMGSDYLRFEDNVSNFIP